MEKVLASKVFGSDFRLSRTASSVRLEMLDYHAGPLVLTARDLREMGISIVDREPRFQSEILDFDYRFSRIASTVLIETLDYHAEPLLLSDRRLRKFGLGISHDTWH